MFTILQKERYKEKKPNAHHNNYYNIKNMMMMPGSQPVSQSMIRIKEKVLIWLFECFVVDCYRKTIYDRSRKSTHIQNDKVKTKQQ